MTMALPGLTTPRVVGIDPSLTATGLAWASGQTLVHGIPGITAKDVSYPERGQRMLALARHLLELLTGNLHIGVDTMPELAVIEGYELHSPGSGSLAERCWLWYALLNGLTARGVPIVVVPPTKLKLYAIGKGVGKKEAVIDSAARRLPTFATGGDNNAVDAVWLCALGCDLLGRPLAPMPETHRAALKAVKLPEGVTTHAR